MDNLYVVEETDNDVLSEVYSDVSTTVWSTTLAGETTTTFDLVKDSFNLSDSFEDYDYDIHISENTYFWPELIPTLIVYCFTLVLGLSGNVLIIFTIARYRRMKSTTNVFLASLASADLLLILFCIPVKLAKLFSYTWTMGLFLCKLVHYMQSVSAICSVLTLTAMSIERYYAIVHPMKAKYVCTISQARRIITATWVAAFLLAVPTLFAQTHMKVGARFSAFWCVRDFDNQKLWRAHELYMLLLILVIPTCVMGVAYTAICWEVWDVTQRRQDMTSARVLSIKRNDASSRSLSRCSSLSMSNMNGVNDRKRSRRRDLRDDDTPVKQVIKMLVAVVVIFVICWGPMLIDSLLTAYSVLPNLRQGSLKYMKTAFHLMAYFNSCINPVVYGFMSKNFRQSFQKTLCCRKQRLHHPPIRTSSISQTRNTSLRFAETSFGRSVSITVPNYSI